MSKYAAAAVKNNFWHRIGSTVTAAREDRYLALQICQTKRAAKPLSLVFAASLLRARALKLFKLPSYAGFANIFLKTIQNYRNQLRKNFTHWFLFPEGLFFSLCQLWSQCKLNSQPALTIFVFYRQFNFLWRLLQPRMRDEWRNGRWRSVMVSQKQSKA